MVKLPAVVDAACLIGLERINALHLLPALLNPVTAPPAVVTEFGSLPAWLAVEEPSDHSSVRALELMLDRDESEAIALAQEKGVRIILDDRKAREVAARMGVPVTGTIGLLIKAKQSGIIPVNRPLLDALDAGQFHISHALREEALLLANEPLILPFRKALAWPPVRALKLSRVETLVPLLDSSSRLALAATVPPARAACLFSGKP